MPLTLDEEIVYRMFSPQALQRAESYLIEEGNFLNKLILETLAITSMKLVVVGSANLMHLPTAMQHMQGYLGIDPLMHIFINDSIKFLIQQNPKISLLSKKFDDITSEDLPSENSLYVFPFNVISYIKNPIEKLSKIIKKKDIIFISSWNLPPKKTLAAKNYFNYLYGTNKAQTILKDMILNLEELPYHSLKYYKKSSVLIGKTASILTIST